MDDLSRFLAILVRPFGFLGPKYFKLFLTLRVHIVLVLLVHYISKPEITLGTEIQYDLKDSYRPICVIFSVFVPSIDMNHDFHLALV